MEEIKRSVRVIVGIEKILGVDKRWTNPWIVASWVKVEKPDESNPNNNKRGVMMIE